MFRLLVIEDDPFVRRLLELHLRNAGYEVELAPDPVEGLKAVLQSPPQLVLLDVQMPYMNGLEVLKALKSDDSTRHIPVVMLTSCTDDETWNEALKNGADAYLNKPIRIDKVLETVTKLLSRTERRFNSPG